MGEALNLSNPKLQALQQHGTCLPVPQRSAIYHCYRYDMVPKIGEPKLLGWEISAETFSSNPKP